MLYNWKNKEIRTYSNLRHNSILSESITRDKVMHEGDRDVCHQERFYQKRSTSKSSMMQTQKEGTKEKLEKIRTQWQCWKHKKEYWNLLRTVLWSQSSLYFLETNEKVQAWRKTSKYSACQVHLFKKSSLGWSSTYYLQDTRGVLPHASLRRIFPGIHCLSRVKMNWKKRLI